MKRVAAPMFVVFVVVVSSLITFAVGRKVASDRYRGSYCNDWIAGALRDAKREGSEYKDARTSYNVEFSVFIQTLSTGVYFEGANYGLTPPAGSARPAPYKICTRDYSGSSLWKKYRPAQTNRDAQ